MALAVLLHIREGYHINANAEQWNPSAEFRPVPTDVRVARAHPFLRTEPALFPKAHQVRLDFLNERIPLFQGRIVVYLPVAIAAEAEPKMTKVLERLISEMPAIGI